MTENRDPRPVLTLAFAQARALVDRVVPADLERPTPCADYDVRALLGHLLAVADRVATLPQGIDLDTMPRVITDVADDDLAAEFARRSLTAEEAWAEDSLLGQTFALPWATLPGFAAVATYVLEMATHGWDLATAIDASELLDPAVGAVALEIGQMALPIEPRGGEVPFGTVVPVPDDADVYTRLAGWMGREPVLVS